MPEMSDIELKRGDTLTVDVTRVDRDGNPIDCTGFTITAMVALDDFSAPITVTPINLALGRYKLSASASATALWPLARMKADVKYDEGGGVIRRSKDIPIRVSREITP